jgi:hypothetical protein
MNEVWHYAPACSPKRVERWRRNGATKRWVTRPNAFRIPIKHGLRDYSYLTDENAHDFHLEQECPYADKS